MEERLENRVRTYWTQRAHDFGAVRRQELHNDLSARWLAELERHSLPGCRVKRIEPGIEDCFIGLS